MSDALLTKVVSVNERSLWKLKASVGRELELQSLGALGSNQINLVPELQEGRSILLIPR